MKEIDNYCLTGKFTNAVIHTNDVDQNTLNQITEMINCDVSEGSVIHIMPDCHAGKGCTIGTTMTIKDRVCPNLVGVDVGCFSGDTKVKLTDGRDLSFLELIEEEKKGIEHYGYSLDKNGHVQISKLELPRKIKTVPHTYIITLDNDEKIRCTDDHIFYKRNLEEVKAKDLKVGDSLYPLYIKKRNELLNEKFLSINRLSDENDDHLCVYDVVDNGYKYIHWLSDDYNFRHNRVRIVHKFVRHHVDFNKFNNDPTNIERVTYKEHFKIHSDNIGYLSKIGKWGYKRVIEKYGEKKAKEFCSIAGKKGAYSTWHGEKVDELRKKSGERFAAWNKSDVAREKVRQRQLTNNSTKFSEQNNQEWFKNRQKISRIKKYLDYMVENNLGITKENWKFVRPNFYNCYQWDKMNSILNEVHLTYQDVLDGKVNKNHYIKAIEKIDEEIDVYCLTCFEFSNFALSSGVFVHNCGILCLKAQGEFSVDDFLDACEKVPSGVGKYNTKMIPFDDIKKLSFQLERPEQALYSIGTLGSGNHFIELNEDEDGNHYIVIHTGSRNLGIQVCSHHMEIAKKTNLRGSKGDLSFLTGTDLDNYLNDMKICQTYAQKNRLEIGDTILRNLGNAKIVDAFVTTHNYIDFDDNILRKGAISCTRGKRVLIPFNMRDGSVIAIGKGNPDWNYSGPHGAGRIMSRSQAKKNLSLLDYQNTMKGISSRTVCQNTIDEAPQVYKDAKEIENLISETVEVQKHLKVIANYKGF